MKHVRKFHRSLQKSDTSQRGRRGAGGRKVKPKLKEKLLMYTSSAWFEAFNILSHTEEGGKKEVEEDRREESIW